MNVGWWPISHSVVATDTLPGTESTSFFFRSEQNQARCPQWDSPRAVKSVARVAAIYRSGYKISTHRLNKFQVG